MQPLIFKLTRLRKRGIPVMLGDPILPATFFKISGITKDNAGSPLGNCTVKLFRTRDDALMDKQISDATGNYMFRSVSMVETYYVTAYKAGSPDVTGTTINTLIGA